MRQIYFIGACIISMLVVITVSSCRTVRGITETRGTTVDTVQSSNQVTCPPIVLDSEGKFIESDDYLLIGAQMVGKCVEIEVEYSGGCEGDKWTLAWDGMLMKSLPPKANIRLH